MKWRPTPVFWGFPSGASGEEKCSIYLQGAICRASLVAQEVKNPPAMWETWVRSLGWEDRLEKRKATPVFWPGEFHD